MRVLVACEYSGVVREEFKKRGHYALSCDILPTDIPGEHYQGNALDILGDSWDLMIAHPPCTRLCNSGVRWLHERDLWEELRKGAEFFCKFLQANIPKIAVENPVMHKYAVEIIGRRQNFCVQPWQHGEPYTKRTCFWTKGLPELIPSDIVEGREAAVHLMPPGADRSKERSKTYKGIARAMAEQWG